MAARLTDKQKKQIIADYAVNQSYNATAKLHGVSHQTVKRVVQRDPETAQKVQQKKEQNTADILDYMDSQRKDVCKVLGICLGELKKPERYAKTPPPQIATTMAILIDKYTALDGNGINDKPNEDKLSKSLRELGEELESDV